MTSKAELKKFEDEIDQFIRALPVLNLPARAIHAGLHLALFTLRPSWLNKEGAQETLETIISRLAYSLEILASRPATPYGANAEDAINTFREADPEAGGFKDLLAYLHFSQIMPEVWRKYYDAQLTDGVLTLSHASEEFAIAEANDILLSDLAMSFRFHRSENEPDADVARLARTVDNVDLVFFAAVVMKKAAKYRSGIAEFEIVSDKALQEILGVNNPEFDRIQAALMGLAETCEEMALFLTAWWQEEHGREMLPSEAVEWISVNLKPEIIYGIVATVAKTTTAKIRKLVEAYAIDYRTSPASSTGGDGFFPPFALFPGALLFSPILVQVFLSKRNAVYGFAERSRKEVSVQQAAGEEVVDRFGSLIANDLEPTLLMQAVAVLPENHNWIVREGLVTANGEIDLVLIDPVEQFALCIQAKAPLPPQGARLTARLSSRVNEGIEQIRRFSSLDQEERRTVIEKVANVPLPDLKIQDVILVRACFGAPEVWLQRPNIIPTTLALWCLAAINLRAVTSPTLRQFAASLDLHLDEYLKTASPRWEPSEFTLAGRTIKLPLLKSDQSYVAKMRERAWPKGTPAKEENLAIHRRSET